MKLHYPLDKIFITQYFGERSDVYKPLKGHDGIDFRTKFSDTPHGKRVVFAAATGIVKNVANQGNKGYGKYIRIQHEDGSQTLYGHLTTWYVKPEQRVLTGEKIGLSGNTGFSSAPHLHFGYRPPYYNYDNGFSGYIDPLTFFTSSMSSSEELHPSRPLSLMKKIDNSALYLYGYDGKWYGLQNMKILQLLTGPYNKQEVTVVEELPQNISNEVIRLEE